MIAAKCCQSMERLAMKPDAPMLGRFMTQRKGAGFITGSVFTVVAIARLARIASAVSRRDGKGKAMKIKVEACWNGHQTQFRLTNPKGERETITAFYWDRDAAKRALNLYENVYGYKRANIRFEVH